MKYQRFLSVKVKCPRDQKIYVMPIEFAAPDFTFPFPSNGCDETNDCETCARCRASVTLMFFHGIDYISTDVISPDFSILK